MLARGDSLEELWGVKRRSGVLQLSEHSTCAIPCETVNFMNFAS